MSLYDLQLQTLKSVLSEPTEALSAWKNLVARIGFDHLPNTTNRFLPRIYLQLRGLEGVPELNRLRGTYKLNWARNARLLGQISPLIESLRGEGIHFFAIKGLAVALNTGSLGARVFGDVDLVVEPDSVQQATRIMSAHGWTLRDPNSPLGLRGLGAYEKGSGQFIDLHALDQFPLFLQAERKDLTYVAWQGCEIPIPSRRVLSMLAIHHGTGRAAESDLPQAIVDFVDLSRGADSAELEEVLVTMKVALAMSDFLPLLVETKSLAPHTIQLGISSRKTEKRRQSSKLSLTALRKGLLAPRLILRRRLESKQLTQLLRATRQNPRIALYALWMAFGQFRPVERALMKAGLAIARPAHLFARGGPVPERDFRLVVVNPFPECPMVSITLKAENDTNFSSIRERSLAINGTAFGFFPVDGNFVARYLVESPGQFIDLSLISSHRLAVQQFKSVEVQVREVAF